jgi:hypothetical protein
MFVKKTEVLRYLEEIGNAAPDVVPVYEID